MSTAPSDVAAEAAAAIDETAGKLPSAEERNKQFQAFMAKMLGDISRLNQQVNYLGRQHGAVLGNVEDRLTHLEGCVAMLFEALHIEMPKLAPKLIDAQVDLVAELDEEEVCEMRASYSANKHPVFGHYQIIVGAEGEEQPVDPARINPLVIQRLTDAFTALKDAGTLVDGQFYYVRLRLLHAQPIDASSVPVQVAAPTGEAAFPATVDAGVAANDDAEPAAETADVQSE